MIDTSMTVPAELLYNAHTGRVDWATVTPPPEITHKDAYDPLAASTPAYYTGWVLKLSAIPENTYPAVPETIYKVGEYRPETDTYTIGWPD